jgi:hypothetical protein
VFRSCKECEVELVCDKVFYSIVNDSENKLLKLLRASNNVPYDLRENRYFIIPEWKTIIVAGTLI